jgi:hypothetical protein
MGLEITVKDYHFMVADGCKINQVNSCLSSDITAYSRGMDMLKRGTSIKDARSFLLMTSLGIIHDLYQFDKQLELKCPSCGKNYTLTKEDFKIGEEAYQEIVGNQS